MTGWNQLSDDQLALIGCGAALVVAFLVMAVSYHVGRFVRGDQLTERRTTSPAAVPQLAGERRRAA